MWLLADDFSSSWMTLHKAGHDMISSRANHQRKRKNEKELERKLTVFSITSFWKCHGTTCATCCLLTTKTSSSMMFKGTAHEWIFQKVRVILEDTYQVWLPCERIPTMWKTWVQSLGWEDPLEEGMVTCSSTLPLRIPWTEEPGGLQSVGWQRFRHDWVTKHARFHEQPRYWKEGDRVRDGDLNIFLADGWQLKCWEETRGLSQSCRPITVIGVHVGHTHHWDQPGWVGVAWQHLISKIFVCVFSVAQSCSTLCDPVDCNLPGSSTHGIS